MILDSGTCVVSRKTNTAEPGAMPVYADVAFWWSWYGELNYETTPGRPTPNREEVRTDARVRILQNREISNHDRVTLIRTDGSRRAYEVTRAWHGRDEESGELISDLTLEVYEP